MSKYTTEVRFICESLSGLNESLGYSSVDNIIETARPKIFDFDYPIFDENYKPILERKILKHFYTREICEETYGLWHLRLSAKLNEIMPYYNKMYESELLEFNPLNDVNKRIEHSGNDSGQSYGTGTSTGKTVRDGSSTSELDDDVWNLYSDTPQGGISGIERAYDGVDDNAYLTDARNIKEDRNGRNTFEDETNTTGNTTNNRTFANKNDWVEIISGKQGTKSYSNMLLEFRKTFLNIDAMILEELNGLFFQLY